MLRTVSATRRPGHRVERRPDQQRHVHRRLVDEEAVRAFAVFAEALAVIAHHHDDGAIGEVMRIEIAEQPADLRIDEGDLADVRMPGVARLERLWRIVRRVRVVEMDPAEEALRADADRATRAPCRRPRCPADRRCRARATEYLLRSKSSK